MSINYGIFKDDTYTKKVVFSKAVLWFKRQLSLRADIMNKIKLEGIKKIIFIDEIKGERWIFSPAKVFSLMVLQTVGQEQQYYFPIDIAKKETYKVPERPEYVYDKARDMYVLKVPGVKAEEKKQTIQKEQVPLF